MKHVIPGKYYIMFKKEDLKFISLIQLYKN